MSYPAPDTQQPRWCTPVRPLATASNTVGEHHTLGPAAGTGGAGTVQAMAKLSANWCPASNTPGDWRKCPGCGRRTSPVTGRGDRVPRHKLPDDVTPTDAQVRLDAAWAAINRTQTALAARRNNATTTRRR